MTWRRWPTPSGRPPSRPSRPNRSARAPRWAVAVTSACSARIRRTPDHGNPKARRRILLAVLRPVSPGPVVLSPGDDPRTPAEAADPARCPSASFAGARSAVPGGRPPDPRRGGGSCSLSFAGFAGARSAVPGGRPPDPRRGGGSCSLSFAGFAGARGAVPGGRPPGLPGVPGRLGFRAARWLDRAAARQSVHTSRCTRCCGAGGLAAMGDLAKIFKAYDIRGVVPDELDETVAEAVGAGFARMTGARAIVTVHDMRASSAPLADAFARGATAQGAGVVSGGLGSTDMLYYASGALGLPGAMITASHNPSKYNGIKLCREGAKPVGRDTGLTELRAMIEQGIAASGEPRGTVTEKDLLGGYADYLKELVDLSGIRPLTVAVDAGNGMAGHT